MSYRIYRFRDVILPNVEAGHEIGSGASRLQIVDVPGGQFDLQGSDERSRRAILPLTVQGLVIGVTRAGVQSAVEGYKALRGLQGTLYRRLYDDTIQTCTARLDSVAGVHGSRDSLYQPLTFTFNVLSQAWLSQAPLISTIYDLVDGILPLPRRHATAGGVYTRQISYLGNIEQTALTFTATARGAGFTSLKVENLTTGHWWQWQSVTACTTTLVVDTGLLSVKNNGVGDYVHFSRSSSKRDWFWIEPVTPLSPHSINTLEITVTGDIASLTVSLYHSYS